MPGAIRIGTSGWIYADWRGVLYERGVPQRRWLERYAEVFDSVELNFSFYRLPTTEQFAAWKERTPPGFAFALKGSRLITHLRRLRGVEADVATFFERARALGRKAAVTLWQLPPNLECDPARIERFAKLLPRGRSRRQAVEFRHASWYAPEVYALLERHGMGLVLPHAATREHMTAPSSARPTADFVYLRFHHGGGRGGTYTDAELRRASRRIRRWLGERDVYAYFNNDSHGFAVRNARRLRELLGGG